MSFVAGRSAAAEGAYFLQESKQAVSRFLQKTTSKPNPKPKPKPKPNHNNNNNNNNNNPLTQNSQADVLPEVLKHSLPSKIFQSQPSIPSDLSTSKWVLPSQPHGPVVSYVSREALNPLKGYVSLPQVTFGPKRWQLPESQSSILASTANELRRDKYAHINPEKMKAAALGVTQIAKAFAAATAIIFGSATVVMGTAVSKLDLHNGDDVKTKGKDLVQHKLEMVKEQLIPLKDWAEDTSKKWRLERGENVKETAFVKEFNKIMWSRTSN